MARPGHPGRPLVASALKGSMQRPKVRRISTPWSPRRIVPQVGARRCYRPWLRLMRQTALPRHLPDCVGETHGAGGGGVSCCVPLGVVATSDSEKTAGRSRLISNRRFASGRRPGWLRPRKVSPWHISANRSNHRPTSCPTSISTASDGIPCHGADGPQEERFQGGLEPTRKIRP